MLLSERGGKVSGPCVPPVPFSYSAWSLLLQNDTNTGMDELLALYDRSVDPVAISAIWQELKDEPDGMVRAVEALDELVAYKSCMSPSSSDVGPLTGSPEKSSSSPNLNRDNVAQGSCTPLSLKDSIQFLSSCFPNVERSRLQKSIIECNGNIDDSIVEILTEQYLTSTNDDEHDDDTDDATSSRSSNDEEFYRLLRLSGRHKFDVLSALFPGAGPDDMHAVLKAAGGNIQRAAHALFDRHYRSQFDQLLDIVPGTPELVAKAAIMKSTGDVQRAVGMLMGDGAAEKKKQPKLNPTRVVYPIELGRHQIRNDSDAVGSTDADPKMHYISDLQSTHVGGWKEEVAALRNRAQALRSEQRDMWLRARANLREYSGFSNQAKGGLIASYHERATQLSKEAAECDERAAELLLSQQHANIRNFATIDLHGFHRDEAIHALQDALDAWKRQTTTNQRRVFSIITGAGAHSQPGSAKLKNSVYAWLTSFPEYRVTRTQGGVIEVKMR